MTTPEISNLATQYRDYIKEFEDLREQVLDADNERHVTISKINELYVYPLPGLLNFTISPLVVDHDAYTNLLEELKVSDKKYLTLVELCNTAFSNIKQLQRHSSVHEMADAYTLVNW